MQEDFCVLGGIYTDTHAVLLRLVSCLTELFIMNAKCKLTYTFKKRFHVSLAFEHRQHVTKISLKFLFIMSLVFPRKDSVGEGDRRIKWIRLLISNNNCRTLIRVISALGR